MKTVLLVRADWDPDARVWTADSDAPEIWYSPLTERRFVVDSKVLSRHTANAVLKPAGLAKKF